MSEGNFDAAQTREMVDHPSHYQSGNGIEVIDVIEAFGLGFSLGNCIKYILRAPKKFNALEDLKKARWYLDRVIFNEEEKAKMAALKQLSSSN